MTTIIGIHGNGASNESFNYIKEQLPYRYDWLSLDYDSDAGFDRNHEMMHARINAETNLDDIVFIAHSMGGLHAARLAADFPTYTRGGITLATPWLGSDAAVMMSLFSPKQVYRDIAPNSDVIRNIKHLTLPGWWTSVVTTKGHSNLMSGANDGIITVASMRGRKDVTYVEVPSTHHEICLSKKAVEVIHGALENMLVSV